MAKDIIQQANATVANLERLSRQQQQRIGQKEALNKQLSGFGFDSLAEAELALKTLKENHEKTVEKTQDALDKANVIVQEAEA